jgi:hypothetical protein
MFRALQFFIVFTAGTILSWGAPACPVQHPVVGLSTPWTHTLCGSFVSGLAFIGFFRFVVGAT